MYIFDFDGVLVDSMKQFTQSLLRVLDEHGISYDEHIADFITPLGYRATAEYFVRELGVQESIESIMDKFETYLYEEYANHIVLKEGVKEFLEMLAARKERLFVLTANSHRMTDICLKRNGIFSYFEKIWSLEEFGDLTKSHTELFDEVARILSCSPKDIHYFDDNIIAIEAATKAGLDTYAVRDLQTAEVWEKLKTIGKHYVMNFSDADLWK